MSAPPITASTDTGAPAAALAAARLLIVATDWDRELRAAAYAIERSRRAGLLRVDVLYVSAPVIAWRALRFWAYARVISWQREQGERLLRAHHDRLADAGIAVTCHLRIDEPARAISRLASEIAAECVVLPTPPSSELPAFRYWWDVHKIVRQGGTPVVLA
jgi:nucleotide-binding universal stress UspA family protein